MSKIRALIVDDSAFMRRVIKQMLESDPEVEVVGTARDGAEGVEMAQSLTPDVITMDLEMPRMDGLEAIEVIMEKLPTPIIVISSLTQEGAKATFNALDRGAADYIPKNLTASAFDMMKIEGDLLSKVKAIALKKKILAGIGSFKKPAPLSLPKKGFVTQNIAFIAIGASTGGPRAIQEVLAHLPGKLSTPVLLAVHMPKAFTGAFAERLNELSELSVKEAEAGERVRPGCALLAPGGSQTRIKRKGLTDCYIEISDVPADSIYKPSVDISMKSVADCYPGRSMGIILTGMGHDGREGMRRIKEKGGKTIAQSEETCTVYGMPRAVVEAGLADKVVPLERIASEIINMI